ncbi:hypothetical protein KL86DPRO_10883 [uncultured delta proteobacterium]|uniref:Uncharacterized protein n=1 Tax=uncultured delta proteobacterium TaxID=34034 RepID=A0A212J7S5_9DELT|nr:hypothetical protein KL86DPRO_10883 [uncultured delta proteobacterium]
MMDDLLDLITDPDLGGCSFRYGRITETVNDKGRAELSEQLLPADGNIQPAPGKEREVLEEGDRQKAAILIFTPANLTAGESKDKADRIYHEGSVYRVSLAEPWQHHAGFTKAIAVLERPL